MILRYYEFNGLVLPVRSDTGYINATALSSRYFEQTGKYRKPSHWLALKRTEETIAYVSLVTQIPSEHLVIKNQGGNDTHEQGTFLHPDLAIPFASWLSVEFEYKVTKIIQQHVIESSSSGLAEQIDDLWRVLNVMYAYLQSAQGMNRTLHTGIHNQSAQINPALKEIESLIKRYRLNPG